MPDNVCDPWPQFNRERGELIDKNIAGTISDPERHLLDVLNAYADEGLKATGACECPTREALESAKRHVNHREDIAEVCYAWCPACKISAALAAPCPCAGMREQLERERNPRATSSLAWTLANRTAERDALQSECDRLLAQGRKNFDAALGFQDRAMRAEAERDRLRAELANFGTVTPCPKCDGSGKDERGSDCCRIPGHARDCGCLICQWKNACYRNENEGNQARFHLTASEARVKALEEALRWIVARIAGFPATIIPLVREIDECAAAALKGEA